MQADLLCHIDRLLCAGTVCVCKQALFARGCKTAEPCYATHVASSAQALLSGSAICRQIVDIAVEHVAAAELRQDCMQYCACPAACSLYRHSLTANILLGRGWGGWGVCI